MSGLTNNRCFCFRHLLTLSALELSDFSCCFLQVRHGTHLTLHASVFAEFVDLLDRVAGQFEFGTTKQEKMADAGMHRHIMTHFGAWNRGGVPRRAVGSW